jgi:hypothetical protein
MRDCETRARSERAQRDRVDPLREARIDKGPILADAEMVAILTARGKIETAQKVMFSIRVLQSARPRYVRVTQVVKCEAGAGLQGRVTGRQLLHDLQRNELNPERIAIMAERRRHHDARHLAAEPMVDRLRNDPTRPGVAECRAFELNVQKLALGILDAPGQLTGKLLPARPGSKIGSLQQHGCTRADRARKDDARNDRMTAEHAAQSLFEPGETIEINDKLGKSRGCRENHRGKGGEDRCTQPLVHRDHQGDFACKSRAGCRPAMAFP